jgi:hypothetical protein
VAEGCTAKSEAKPTEKSSSKVRFRTVATILAGAIYFQELCQCKEMVDLLGLLASLAVDDSETELGDIVHPLVLRAIVTDPDLWALVAEECPWIYARR